MDERRRLKRWPLAVYPCVLDEESGAVLGRVADITVEGMLMTAEAPLPVGRVYRLRLDLLQKQPASESTGVQAEVMWCRQSANPLLFDVGLRFVEAGLRTVMAIQAAVEELGLDAQ